MLLIFLQPLPPEMYHLMLCSLTKIQDHQFHGIRTLETEHAQQARTQSIIIQQQEITQCRLSNKFIGNNTITKSHNITVTAVTQKPIACNVPKVL